MNTSTKNRYADLDAAIIAYLTAGADTTLRGMLEILGAQAAALDPAPRERGMTPGYRVLDRRLQALRRAGVIKFVRGGWLLSEDSARKGSP